MLVAGDFNSIPGSAAHSLLVKGRVEPSQLVSRLSCLAGHPAHPCMRNGLTGQAGRTLQAVGWVHSWLQCCRGRCRRFVQAAATDSLSADKHACRCSARGSYCLSCFVLVLLQEASVDPLGLLRDTKLQHSLPLASAYAALLDYPPTNEQLKRQRARLDPTNREPLFTNFNR